MLLKIDHLSVTFPARGESKPVQAVKNLSLQLARGEMLALVGESGSGKSLTALAALGLLPGAAQREGIITLAAEREGEPPLELTVLSEKQLCKIRGNRISMIFQEPMTALNPLHTIGKQISEVLKLHDGHLSHRERSQSKERQRRNDAGEGNKGAVCCVRSAGENDPKHRAQNTEHLASHPHPKSKISTSPIGRGNEKRIRELLSLVGLQKLHDRLDAYPHQLSGGERQRVMIAMAMACEPDILIADEPTTAVDVTIQAQILDLLQKLQQERGLAILFITHDLNIVEKMADRVAVMKAGELVEQGETKAVFAKPAHDYTRKLLDSAPDGSAPPAPTKAKPILQADNVTIRFAQKKSFFGKTTEWFSAVDDISVSLAEQSTLGVVGESGSGKTTLALALLRLLAPQADIQGKIVYLGEQQAELSALSQSAIRPLRQQLQIVFQDPYGSLNPRMTVERILAEGLRVHEPNLSAEQRRSRCQQALEETGLTAEMLDRYPHEFSGGQRQRIAIARAMVLNPRFVVLDEPTSALDRTVQKQIIELLLRLQKEHRTSFLFISHDLRVVRALSHEVIVMQQGKVVEHGPAEQIFNTPQQDYTKKLLKAAFLAA